MIKSKDLRIGNYVSYLTSEGDGSIMIITADCIMWCSEDSRGFNLINHGIQITPYWLLKFGFYEGENNWYKKQFSTDCMEAVEFFTISVNSTTFRYAIYDEDFELTFSGLNTMTGKVIKYVHQLQNLYYFLTGNELEIEETSKKLKP